MSRQDFIRICGLLGIGLPLQFSLMSCKEDDEVSVPFHGKVIVIGAGAGGLSSGYLLQQNGIDFEILEASTRYGGRIKVNATFADFPIPLGAEWIETTSPTVFQDIVNNPSVPVTITTFEDTPDRKFHNYSWYNFFEEFIVPSISNRISYNSIVESIDYSGERVLVNTQNGQHIADKVIVSVPLKILQQEVIRFIPSLPQRKLNAITNTVIWEGFKAFFEFSTKFYEDEYVFQVTPTSKGQKLYYNASLGQHTVKNILGLFVVGAPAQDYISRSVDELKDFILSELDGIYSNQATQNYMNHITQNWNDEPFIKGGYMTDYADWRTVRELGGSIADKIYFAGGEYTDGENWVSVHTAAESAKKAVGDLQKAV